MHKLVKIKTYIKETKPERKRPRFVPPPKVVCKYAEIIQEAKKALSRGTQEEKFQLADRLFAMSQQKPTFYCPAPSIDLVDPEEAWHQTVHQRPQWVLSRYALKLKGKREPSRQTILDFFKSCKVKGKTYEDAANASVAHIFELDDLRSSPGRSKDSQYHADDDANSEDSMTLCGPEPLPEMENEQVDKLGEQNSSKTGEKRLSH